jgi:hypothetical protein
MIVRRLVTALVAIGLIVGALLIRRNVIEGDDDDADAGNGPGPAAQLTCLTELAKVCAAIAVGQAGLDVRVEDSAVTLERLAAGEAVPLWLTFEPFPAMASDAGETAVLAASELAVTAPPGRLDVLSTHCPTTALWRCIGDAAGDPWASVGGEAGWGRVEPSVGDAGKSAAALASFASAAAGYFGTTSFGAVDLQDPSFLAWVRPLVQAVPVSELSGRTPLATMLTRPSAVNLAATSDAEIAALDAPAGKLESRYPEPSMWLQAVLAAPAGADLPRDLRADAAAALLAQGWDRPSTATAPLPSATTMVALRNLWEDIQ